MAKNDSMEKLASAMEKLADKLEKFQDPIVWQKIFTDASDVWRQEFPPTPGITGVSFPVPQAQAITISLTEEERAELVNLVHRAIQPQLEQLNDFINQALKEMPSERLKKLAQKIKAGEMPKIKRRKGCVFIAAGDYEAYLPL